MKLRIGTKILLGNLVTVLLMVVMAVISINSLSEVEHYYKQITTDRIPEMDQMSELKYFILRESYYVRGYMLTGKESYINDFENARQKANETSEEIKKHLSSEQAKINLQKIDSLNAKYYNIAAEALRLTKAGKRDEAAIWVNRASATMAEIEQITSQWDEIIHKNITADIEHAIKTGENANKTFYTVTVTAVLLGILASWIFGKLISGSIQKITLVAAKLAANDLTVNVPDVKTRDEVEILANSMSEMVVNLRTIIGSIGDSASQVASSSQQIANQAEHASEATQQVAKAIQEVAKGTSHQTENVVGTVAAMDQVAEALEQIAAGAHDQNKNVLAAIELVDNMTGGIDQTAATMDEIREASRQSGVVAKEGGQAVEQTVVGMERVKNAVFETAERIKVLGEQSKQIGEIIQVIDDIAAQTNLLALNAAIEAARAGEHGKGFAVVADEVRKLAERSGKATKEIEELITNIQRGTDTAVRSMEIGTREVEEGVEIARVAGNSLKEIVSVVDSTGESIGGVMELINNILEGSRKVAEAMDNIASITEQNTASTQQMSAAAKQVNVAMHAMSAVTKENAASAEEVSVSTEEMTASNEEIASSVEELSEMAGQLRNMVVKFKV